jgi:hypothetical protein
MGLFLVDFFILYVTLVATMRCISLHPYLCPRHVYWMCTTFYNVFLTLTSYKCHYFLWVIFILLRTAAPFNVETHRTEVYFSSLHNADSLLKSPMISFLAYFYNFWYELALMGSFQNRMYQDINLN